MWPLPESHLLKVPRPMTSLDWGPCVQRDAWTPIGTELIVDHKWPFSPSYFPFSQPWVLSSSWVLIAASHPFHFQKGGATDWGHAVSLPRSSEQGQEPLDLGSWCLSLHHSKRRKSSASQETPSGPDLGLGPFWFFILSEIKSFLHIYGAQWFSLW